MFMRISNAEVLHHFTYDAVEGKLYRRFSKGGHLAGEEAGGISEDGYRVVKVKGVSEKVHRIIYQLERGQINQGKEIDHIDGNRLNNKIDNLRAVTRQENGSNKKIPKTNTSGVVGVTWSKPHSKWKVQIKYKQSVLYLGLFSEKELAIQARKAAEAQYGFHPNHGRVVQ
jgi:hypothetical protein